MKIKLTAMSCSPYGTYPIGAVLSDETIPAQVLRALLDGGYAVPVKEQTVERATVTPTEDAAIKHVGGSMYELPNGERIRGKQAALAALTGR
jgi:hypothetical protein